MLVTAEDLQELDEPSGARFQDFVTALVQAEAICGGLNPTDVDADYRTNHADGGCDIYVSKGQNQTNASLIPEQPSIWSIKKGANGIDPGKLAEELSEESHPRLIKHLKGGGCYCWCALAPAGQIERTRMRDKADVLASKLGIEPKLIRLVWNDHLTIFANRHLNLIAEYLPKFAATIRPMVTLEQWKWDNPDKKGLKVPFVHVPGSMELQRRIHSHLLERGGDAVFHLAGLSGIGKTRTVVEACLANSDLSNTLYIGKFADVGPELWRRFLEIKTHIKLIIDEVPLEELTRLQDRFCNCGDRIRIVSIGPAPRGQSRRQRDPMLQQLQPPDETTGVLPIVEAAAPELTGEVRRSIAHFSGHDLRLALLLVDATRISGEFSTAPLRDFEDVWNRIIFLFRSQIRNPILFRELYELLTLAIDVGHSGDHRAELRLLATFFSKSEADLDRAILDASECGLGVRLQSFFEAKPAALAVWLFQERLWPVMSPRLDEFVEAKPSSRLLRRFLERCHETASPYREDIESKVGAFFLRLLGNPQLNTLNNREPSRIFQAWAEFDPERGLNWLERAIVVASDDDLRQFSGDPDGSGGWRGRRQIVWLCENLACFSEYFDSCERILFRLAQVETEVRIGNNSTNTWREMFLPILAHTEVPFPARLDLLTQRLQTATPDTIDLILSAFYTSIERFISRMAPPRIVGGRIVPDQWKPTTEELKQCRHNAAKRLLQTISNLSPTLRERASKSVVNEIAKFLDCGIVNELRDALTISLDDDSLKRQLLSKLDEWLSWRERQAGEGVRVEQCDAVRQWRGELSPTTLQGRIKDLTARAYWSVHRATRGRGSDANPESPYSELAKEVLQQPDIVAGMTLWFLSSESQSAAVLFRHLGLNDGESKLLHTMLRWLESAKGIDLVASYLEGLVRSFGALPQTAIQSIDEAAKTRPSDVIQVTLYADASEQGLRRLMNSLPRLETNQRAVLRQVAFEPWSELLGIQEKVLLLEQFCAWAEFGDSDAVRTGIDIFAMWRDRTSWVVPRELAPPLIHLAKLASMPDVTADDYGWKAVMEAVAPLEPGQIAEMLANEITSIESRRFHRSEYAQEVLEQIAKDHPEAVMQAIGRWVLDKKRGAIFRMFVFRGLFDAIGLQTVKPWVEKHGNVAAIGIARHLDGPRLENDQPIIPELADWLLSTYHQIPKVFSEFAMGRHSGEIRSGHSRDQEADLTTFLSHFESNTKEWVQKWIEYERQSHQQNIKMDDEMDEEENRL